MPNGPLMIDVSSFELNDIDREILVSPTIAGVILFARNIQTPEQVAALCDDIRSINPDLLIGVDQEGGRVQRLKQGFTRLPAMRKFGELYDKDLDTARRFSEICGWLMASEVISVGIDFSFAPVLDLDLAISDVIGDRAFHQDPRIASELATVFTHGMYQAGMIAVGKHFPGHGGVSPDSHVELPVDSRSLNELHDEISVFKHLIEHDLSAIMPAHILFSSVDDELVTYSNKWLQQILRDDLGFNGIIISDDLTMAAAHTAPMKQRVNDALQAGCDMILICNDQNCVLKLLENPEPHWQQDFVKLRMLKAKQNLKYDVLIQNPNWQNAKNEIENLLRN